MSLLGSQEKILLMFSRKNKRDACSYKQVVGSLSGESDDKLLKLFLAGTTPYSDNRGNAAIFGGILEFISKFKGYSVRVTAWHTYPESNLRLIKSAATTDSNFGKASKQLNVNIVPYSSPESPIQAFMVNTAKLFGSILSVLLIRTLRFFHLEPARKPIVVDELMSADAIIELTFGDTFTDTYYGRILWFYNSLRLTLEYLSKKPVYFFPQSIGPFKSVFGRAFARIVLNNSKMVALRENYSIQNVVNLGVENSKIHFIPDMSFWLPIAPSTDALKILQENGVYKSSSRKLVGILLSANILTRRKTKMSLKTAAKAIDCLIESLDADIVFIPHGTSIGPHFDTCKFSLLIHKMLKNKNKAIVLTKDYTVEELWGVIGQCDITISTLTHPVMSSLRQGIPVIALSYSHKTLGIMKLFGMERYVLSYDDFGDDKLIVAAKELLRNSEAIKVYLQNKRAFIKKSTDKFQEMFQELLTQIVTGQ